MVDDRALRFQRRPMGEPPGQTRTQREEPPAENRFVNFVKNANPFAMMGRVNDSLVRPTGEQAAQGYFPETFNASDPGVGDITMDAAANAAGGVIGRGVGAGVGAGLRHAAPLFDEAARRVPSAIPERVAGFLKQPVRAYRDTLDKKPLEQFFAQSDEFIPSGSELMRVPSAGQVAPYRYTQSVPMPREVGAEFLPGRVQSFGGSADLDRLGAIMRGLARDTGGDSWRAPGLVSITAREDLAGLRDLPGYLARNADDIPKNLPRESEFVSEGLLGPATRYILRDFEPGNIPASLRNADGRLTAPLKDADYQVPRWFFDAFRG